MLFQRRALWHFPSMDWKALFLWSSLVLGLQASDGTETRSWSPPSTNEMRDLGDLLGPLRDELKLPGVAAAVVKDGRIFAAGVAGVRKWGTTIPVTIGDRFHLGSITKSATALLAVTHRKQVGLETTPGEVFTDWEMPEGADKITLRLLLQNRSGMGNSPDKWLWARAFRMKGSPVAQREKFLREVMKTPLASEPGTAYFYSNLGYTLAGAMLEKRLGKPWEEMAREEIFEPLKLNSAGFGALLEENDPSGHRFEDGEPKPVPPGDNPVAIAPGGADSYVGVG
jgi:CubicO group peptidase (beta-lactamase class C family)